MLPHWFEPTVEKTCPSCGYKRNAKMDSDKNCPVCQSEYPKDKKQLSPPSQVALATVIIIIIVAWAIWPESKKVTPELSRKERIERAFHPWDGSHPALEQYIRKNMNDPDSYKHVETKYWDNDETIVVQTTFRGKNAFGGVVTNSVKARVSLDGKVLEIIEQNP